jgi:hypothetical protein
MYNKTYILYFFTLLLVSVVIYILFFNYKKYDYKPSEYIASRNFFYASDYHIDVPYSESTEIPTSYPETNGKIIYINTTAIPNFVRNYLPNIKYNFILLSGDTDKTVPDDYQEETNIILNHPLLLQWYAQNSRLVTHKLTQLPIGLDLHTLTNNPKWGPTQSVEEQVIDLEKIKSINVAKINKCYSNFHFGMNGRYTYDRRDAKKEIPKDLVYYEPKPISRIESWRNMINFKYVISPFGNGLDCHRTWEALILGCIPIVKKSDLDPMYKGLPVLIVDNWSDVTQELLDNFKPEYYNIEKLYMKYWINEFSKYK